MGTSNTGLEHLYAGHARTLAEPASGPPATVYWTTATAASLQADAERRFPGEACGLLGGTRTGDVATIAACVPLPNRDPRPDRFAVDSADFAGGDAWLRDRGLVWLGFTHSHPTGDAAPSATDRALLWRCCLQVIVPVRAGVAAPALGHWFDPDGNATTFQLRVLA